jgi:hypothetical protein
MEGCFVEEVIGQFVFIKEDFNGLNFLSSCRIHNACCTCSLKSFSHTIAGWKTCFYSKTAEVS